VQKIPIRVKKILLPILLLSTTFAHAQTWEEYSNKKLDMYERREVEKRASGEGMTVWQYLKKLSSPEEQNRIAQEKQAEAHSVLGDAATRMQKEKGKLMLLIPEAESASDLIRAMAENTYGFQLTDVQGMFEAKWKKLEEAGKMLREGDNSEQLNALYSDAVKKVNETSELLKQLNASCAPSSTSSSTYQSLRKTDRSQMEQAVWIAGLVGHRYDARDLSDEQLTTLHQQALPILETQAVRRETQSALREAQAARQEAQRARDEVRRATQGW